MHRSTLLSVVTALALAFALTFGAVASSAAAADVDAHGTSIAVTSGDGGSHGGGSGRAPVYRNCQDMNLLVHLALPATSPFFGTTEVPTSETVAWRSCERIDDGSAAGWIVGLNQATPTPSATDLALAAEADIVLPLPGVSTSPPRGGRQLDGVPVWFWMAHPEPVSATASIPGLSATLIATPTSSRYSITDGATFTCPDLGTPYDPGRPSAGQHSSCTHTFDDHGTFTVTATVDWELRWVATDGESGTLPPIARTTTFPLTLQEGQAVTD